MVVRDNAVKITSWNYRTQILSLGSKVCWSRYSQNICWQTRWTSSPPRRSNPLWHDEAKHLRRYLYAVALKMFRIKLTLLYPLFWRYNGHVIKRLQTVTISLRCQVVISYNWVDSRGKKIVIFSTSVRLWKYWSCIFSFIN